MNRRLFDLRNPWSWGTLAVLFALTASLAAEAGETKGKRPDLLLVVADDMDPQHFGFRNPLAHTPTLDRLVREGVLFERAWMPPRCAPSLASILTGMHPHEHGRYFNANDTGQERTLDPELFFVNDLRDAGYRCFKGGKWWYGDMKAAGFEAGNCDDSSFVRSGQEGLFQWLNGLDDEDSFFLWWAPRLPHTPHNPQRRHVDLIDRSRIEVPDYAVDPRGQFVTEERKLLAMGAWMDEGLTELLGHLNSIGRDDNLLIVFCIDNGWSNGRPSKGSPYEKGWQSPLIFHHPSQVPSGIRKRELASVVDLYPTLLDYAGLTVSSPSDGRSLRPLIEGAKIPWRTELVGVTYPSRSRALLWHEEAIAFSLRSDRWKYIVYLQTVTESENDRLKLHHLFAEFPERVRADEELYFLPDDPLELNNLIGQPEHGSKVRRARERSREWWDKRAPRPRGNRGLRDSSKPVPTGRERAEDR